MDGRDVVVPVGVEERSAAAVNGFVGLAGGLLLLVGGVATFVAVGVSTGDADPEGMQIAALVGAVVLLLCGALLLSALTVVPPGRVAVVQLFGRYLGTLRRSGLSLVVPFATRTRMSLRVRNFETERMKVNDATGNPVELAGIVVWQIEDTAAASFAVEDVEEFVAVQAEAALRHVARSYPYDAAEGVESLSGSTEDIAGRLDEEMSERMRLAGVRVLEVRISHLAYAPEIAQAMLQRQQAGAVVAARSQLVDGAVSMVRMALDELREQGVVELDDERRAAMVSNLLVVLCGDSRATPVVNAGTLYA